MMRPRAVRAAATPPLIPALLVMLVLLACSDAAGPLSAHIHLTVTGVPVGSVNLLVKGPNFSRVVAADSSDTIEVPRAGSYSITAPAVLSYGVEYTPTPATQMVSVARGRAVDVTVAYALSATTLQNNVPIVASRAAAVDPGGTFQYYRMVIPTGAIQLTVASSGVAAAYPDLYVRRGAPPTPHSFDCHSADAWTGGICAVTAPQAGEWFILLHDYQAYSGVQLQASYVEGGTLALAVSGLPSGAAARIAVSGPREFSANVAGAQVLSALHPGEYAILAEPVVHNDTVYTPARRGQQVNVAGDSTSQISVVYRAATDALNLSVSALYITQATQTLTGSVPLIAGRAGLVRVFVDASARNHAMPSVRVRLYRHGALVATRTIAAPSGSVPTQIEESALLSSWNLRVDGSLIQPGLAILADVDPADGVVEADELDNHFPSTGEPLPLDVRPAPVHRARLVPVLQSSNGLLGDVHTGNVSSYVTLAQAIYPLPGTIDVDVRAPYTFSGVISSAYDSTWTRLLNEIRLLRIADGSARYYFGVLKPGYQTGGTGLGFMGQPAAVGVDWPSWRAYIVAHEWGHNFGRRHVDCGYATASVDPTYPYLLGRPGPDGWDVRTDTLRLASAHYDVMSYCHPSWISDHTYTGVMNFRANGTAPAAVSLTPQPALLIWGRVGPDGVVLEPAFEIVTRPLLPDAPGRYTLRAEDATGAHLLELSFDGEQIDHLDHVRHFAYAIPLTMLGGRWPGILRLRADGRETVQRPATVVSDDFRVSRRAANRVRLQWNAARNPLVIVRDPRTGETLSFARGGDVEVVTTAPELDVHVSYGVAGAIHRFILPR